MSRYEDGAWLPGPDYLDVHAWRPGGPDAPAEVRALRGSTDRDAFCLTVVEAEQLVEALQLVLGQIETGS